jgi:uncharacterized protein
MKLKNGSFGKIHFFQSRQIVIKNRTFGKILKIKRMKIIGRKKEIALLQSLLEQEEASFVAVYGRRRVGKTYLVRQVYQKQIVFDCSGVLRGDMTLQLENFWRTLYDKRPKIALTPPKTWIEAFFQLRSYLNTFKSNAPKVIFLDEIAWFETPNAGFLAALDSFWNQYCTKRPDIILVICGSAASWIIEKVINDKGGLHNRLTNRILLKPFTLGEMKMFLESKKIKLSVKEIAQIYMCIGGIPFYLKDIQKGYSVPQILDQLFFEDQALLKNEFQNLYAALFKNNTFHETIVAALASKNKGLTRNEIIQVSGIKSGGGLTLVLEELLQCGFIKQIFPITKSKEDSLYRLMDEFSLFYYKFLQNRPENNSWSLISQKQSFKIWSGYAFENLCFKHIPQIKQALSIGGVITNEYSYNFKGNTNTQGIQMDMMIERADNCMNLLEIKFYDKEFVVSKEYEKELREKIATFREQTKTQKNIFVTMLSAFGVKRNEQYLSIVTNQLLIDDLFT